MRKKGKKKTGNFLESLMNVSFAKRVSNRLAIKVNATLFSIAMMDVLSDKEIADTFYSVMEEIGDRNKKFYKDAIITILAIGCDHAGMILKNYNDKEFGFLIAMAQKIEDKLNIVYQDYDEIHHMAMIHMQLSGHKVYTYYEV